MPDVNNIDFIDTPVYQAGVTGLFDLVNIEFVPSTVFTPAVAGLDIPLSRITAIGVAPDPPVPSQPVISNVTPAAASAIATNDMVGFDITDPEGFVRILLVADFPGLGVREVIHDGQSFSPNYSGFGNSRVVITNGFRFTILRGGGWPVSPVIIPYAIDTTGQENP